MKRYKATILYNDSRTSEQWTDTEYCNAESMEQATAIFQDRIKNGRGTELVGVDEMPGIIDESGCARYTMTLAQLQTLYKKFENFVADCTQQEYNENKAAIIAVYTLLHKHINAETLK